MFNRIKNMWLFIHMSSNTTVVVAEREKRAEKKEVCDPKPADVPENNVVESCVKPRRREDC
jgi:hypothetical protein